MDSKTANEYLNFLWNHRDCNIETFRNGNEIYYHCLKHHQLISTIYKLKINICFNCKKEENKPIGIWRRNRKVEEFWCIHKVHSETKNRWTPFDETIIIPRLKSRRAR